VCVHRLSAVPALVAHEVCEHDEIKLRTRLLPHHVFPHSPIMPSLEQFNDPSTAVTL
jgi:hypothetical protein